MLTSTIKRCKSYHHRLRTPKSSTSQPPPQAPKQEDFAEPPYRGVIHMITRGSSMDFDTKRQKKDHY
jgi:hypothetical protein